jgi:hypothetical protein
MKYNYKTICLALIITVGAIVALNFMFKPVLANPQLSKPSKGFQYSLPARDKFFISKDIGWKAVYDAQGMFKDEMTLYKTVNGGKSWVMIADTNKLKTIPLEGNKSGMSFISKTKGWITANAPWVGKIGLLTTDNGGVTWFSQKLTIPAKFKNTEINSYPPLILSPRDALFVTFAYLNDNTQHILIYTTHDGGKTWFPFVDKMKELPKGISWKVINRAQRKLSVEYQNNSWIFDGDNWTKDK